MTLYLNIDRFQHDNLRAFASHTSVWSAETAFQVSDMLNLPKPIYATLNNFLNLGQQETYLPQS